MEPPDLPDRQSREYRVQPSRKKYFASRLGRNRFIDSVVPAHQEGRIAIVTDVGLGMRWTQGVEAQSLRGRATLLRTAKSCGPGAPTLALSSQRRFRVLRATVAKEPGHRGEREISR